MADFSKIYLNAVWKTVLTYFEPQYMTFIPKKKFEQKNYFLAILADFWLNLADFYDF